MNSGEPRFRQVLVVDDDSSVLRSVEKTMTHAGFDVRTATSGTDALARVAEVRPDLIIMDGRMPELSGFELCAQLRRRQELARVPVIFLSGLDADAARAEAARAGANAFVRKPFESETLVRLVRKYLNMTAAAEKERALSSWRDWALPSTFAAFKRYLAEKRGAGSEKQATLSSVSPKDLYRLATILNIPNGELTRYIAQFLNVVYVQRLYPSDIDLNVLPGPFCTTNCVAPITNPDRHSQVVISNPFDGELLEVLERKFGRDRSLELSLTEPENIRSLFEENHDTMSLAAGPMTIDAEEEGGLQAMGSSLPDDQSILALANELLRAAVAERASDIHIEPKDRNTIVRCRIDGDMQDVRTLPRDMAPKIISRFKALAGMDIAERRKPQDGALEVDIGKRRFKLRLATTSTSDGESLVVRLLEPTAAAVGLDQLGMTAEQVATVSELGNRHQGMLVMVGPTGSGKSTTVFSILSNVDGQSRSIMSVEDPVEYRIPFANQQQVNEKAGVTFESLLRSAMRQDPDILFLGEIRDTYSASASMDFASSGHLTISTLHSANATTAIFRLERLGISRGTMADSLLGVIAQKLLKKLCPQCKEVGGTTSEEIGWLSLFTEDVPSQVARPVGCPACRGTGYLGRDAIYEILRFDPELGERVRSGSSVAEIRQFARARGDYMAADHSIDKVRDLLFPPSDVHDHVLLEEIRFQQRAEVRGDVAGPPGAVAGHESLVAPPETGAARPVKEENESGTASTGAVPGESAALAHRAGPTRVSEVPRILVVDDDPDTRALIERFLTKGGYEVTMAGDGVEALLSLGQGHFDAVLSDINMPNLDGLSLLEMISQKGIAVPAIFMTADTNEELEEKIFSMGGDEFIQKPIKKASLLHRVGKVVGKRAPALQEG